MTDLRVVGRIVGLERLEEAEVGRAETVEVAAAAGHPVVLRRRQGALQGVRAEEEREARAEQRIHGVLADDRDGRAVDARVADEVAVVGVERLQRVRLIRQDEHALPGVVEGEAGGVVARDVPQGVDRDPLGHAEDEEILAGAGEGPGHVAVGVNRDRAELGEDGGLPVGVGEVDGVEEVLAAVDGAADRVGVRLDLGLRVEVDDADGREERLVEDDGLRGREQLVRDPPAAAVGRERERLEAEGLAVGDGGRRERLVGEGDVGGDGARAEIDDGDVAVDAVRDVDLRPRRRHREPRREAADGDGVGDLPERAVDDVEGAVVLDDDVDPARVGGIPHARARVAAERDGAPHDARLGVEEGQASAGAVDRGEPHAVRAQRDRRDVRADGDLLHEGARVGVDVADCAHVAVRGPDAPAEGVEDDRRRRRVDPLPRRDDRRRRRLERAAVHGHAGVVGGQHRGWEVLAARGARRGERDAHRAQASEGDRAQDPRNLRQRPGQVEPGEAAPAAKANGVGARRSR